MEKKKLSYIIYFVAIVSIGIMPLMNFISEKRIENYNNQFLQYQEIEYREYMYREYKYSYVLDTNNLIKNTINNNKNNKKQVSLIYHTKTYTTEAELKQLQTMLNISTRYYIAIKKDKNYEYIESIALSASPTDDAYIY